MSLLSIVIGSESLRDSEFMIVNGLSHGISDVVLGCYEDSRFQSWKLFLK